MGTDENLHPSEVGIEDLSCIKCSISTHLGLSMEINSQLLDEFSFKIYEAPLSDLRDSGAIRNLSNPVAVLMLLIDFLTEVEMNGINNFLGNSTGLYAHETVESLKLISCGSEADRLAKILSIANAAGMTYEAIQADRTSLHEFEVTSFEKTHGEKWDQASEEIQNVESDLDYDQIRDALLPYFAKHRSIFESLLGGT